ncbi:MAG: hypothetical protein M9909_02800 [Thermomicrobiales bacterium]|nr:hypothetical protein [Thermomicrobiales bacterium]
MQTTLNELENLAHCLGDEPGKDRTLIDWEPMRTWISAICDVSPYLTSQSLGQSTDGRELLMVIASAPDTIRNLEQVAAKRAHLTIPELYRDVSNCHGQLAGDKPVVLVTAGIHADEVGGVQMMPQLILDMARNAKLQAILEKIVLLIIPTLNPDGMQLIHDWYRETLDTQAEGSMPPALYHQYAGHDNNRDWYQHRLQETRAIVDQVHRVWRPHVVIDLHQMGEKSPRYVIPPYIDPVEPNVHPLLGQLSSELGTWIASDHVRAGNQGVCSGVMFDCYSPTRAYQHYHGGVRILAEAASAGIASPISITVDELNGFSDLGMRTPSVHQPLPFTGNCWRLEDIIRLHRLTIESVLGHVADHADRWIADQWRVFGDQVNHASEGAFGIPPLRQQVDPAAARELIDVLRRGDVEIFVIDESDGGFVAGTFVIPLRQPFCSYAQALLSLQPYPAGTAAYDVTSHCLPVHMGVEVQLVDHYQADSLRPMEETDLSPFRAASAVDIRPNAWLAIDPRSSACIRLVNHALKTESRVLRSTKPHYASQRLIPSGAWIIADGTMWDVMAHAAKLHVRTWIIDQTLRSTYEVVAPKLGVYDPQNVSASDYGWLRLWLERAGFESKTITAEDIVHDALDSLDTLIFPHATPDIYAAKGRSHYPAPYARGLSERVTTTLRTWLHRGGHVIAIDGAVHALMKPLELELGLPLLHLHKRTFSSSGAAVRIEPTDGDDITLGIEDAFAAMHLGHAGFELRDSASQFSAAQFGRNNPVVSGTIHGEDRLAGLHAIVQIAKSHGHVTAFAFRPHFRTQMLASETVLTNVIMQQFGPFRRES